jgi:creatinine amidohydrolase
MAEGSPRRYILSQMTWPEVNDALEDIEVVLLPTGSAEQHGPNTGFGTDTGRAEGFCRLLAERMYPRAVAVPPVAYGISHHHMRFPGTATLQPETFMQVVYDVVESYTRHGLQSFLIINGHGGNMPALQLVTMKLRYNLGVRIAYLTPTEVARQEVNAGKTAERIGHACENETSQLLYLGYPEMVRDTALAAGEIQPDPFPHAGFQASIKVPYFFDEVTANGALGDARGASVEYGQATVEAACDRIEEFLHAFLRD